MMETWKRVKGFPNYEVSSEGGVRNAITGRSLKPSLTRGYETLTLISPERKKVTVRVHRLVAEAFIPNPDAHPLVLHGPGGPTDNRASVLRWGTQRENALDSVNRDKTHHEVLKTHCPKGHEYSESNTRRNKKGHRECIDCRKGKDWVITKHGLQSSYARGCRCRECTDAVTRYSQRGIPENDLRHGSYAGYRSGCRCADCKGANNAYEKQRRLKKTGLIE